MTPLRINIVLPFITTKPNGGAKIMYEYANRLHARGHRVTVLHSIQRPYRKIRSPVWWKQLRYRLKGLSRPPWFPLHAGIRSMVVPEITGRYVPDADITMCTWWEMAYMICGLPPSKGKPFNLVQDYEVWKGHEALVHGSYRLPAQHLVIAEYLQHLLEKHSGIAPVHIPNAIDTEKFRITVPVDQRPPQSIIMLYSREPRKDTPSGIEALLRLKDGHPGLTASLFGVYEPPDLPAWIQYHRKPADLPALMNAHAVFFSPSLGEGWALPPAEAMACGCAVVCTDIGGHADYAVNGDTALLVKPGDVAGMVQGLKSVMEDAALRLCLAGNGHRFVTTHFSWKASVDKMEACFAAAATGLHTASAKTGQAL